jgi:branched-chain amino acid transport system substrate-binding protein
MRAVAQKIKDDGIDAIGGVFLPQTAAALLPELARIGITMGGALKVDGAQMTADNSIDLSTNYTQPSTCNFFTKFPPAGGTRFLPQNFGQPYCGKPISPAQEAALNQ